MRYLVFSLTLLWMLSACSRSEKSTPTTETSPEPVSAPTPLAVVEPETEPATPHTSQPVSSTRRSVPPATPTRLENFTAAKAPQEQHFQLDPNYKKVISCQHGTRIDVPANAFTFEDGTPVTTPVRLEVKEFYSKGDYVLAGLGTRSDDRMLESGGMLHLEAWSQDQKLKVAGGKQLKIAMPRRNTNASSDAGMKVFVSDNPADTPPDNWRNTESVIMPDRVRPEPHTLWAHKGGAKEGEKIRTFRGEWKLPQYKIELLNVKARSWAIGISRLPGFQVKDSVKPMESADNYAVLEQSCDKGALPEIPMRYRKKDMEFVVKKKKYTSRFYQYDAPEFVRLDTVQLALQVSGADRWYGLAPEERKGDRWRYNISTFQVISPFDKNRSDLPVAATGFTAEGAFYVRFRDLMAKRIQAGPSEEAPEAYFPTTFHSAENKRLGHYIKRVSRDWRRHQRWQRQRPDSVELHKTPTRAIIFVSAVVRTTKYAARAKVVDYEGYYHYLKTQDRTTIYRIMHRYNGGQYAERYTRRIDDEIHLDLLYNKGKPLSDMYLASVNNLGWINCDRFYDVPKSQRTQLLVKAEAPVRMIFRDINSVMNGGVVRGEPEKYGFSGVPEGAPVTLFSMKQEEGDLYLAMRNTRVGEEQPPLEYRRVEEAELEARLNNLQRAGRPGRSMSR